MKKSQLKKVIKEEIALLTNHLIVQTKVRQLREESNGWYHVTESEVYNRSYVEADRFITQNPEGFKGGGGIKFEISPISVKMNNNTKT